MNTTRRSFLKSALAGSVAGIVLGSGGWLPLQVVAETPKEGFEAKSVNDALHTMYGDTPLADSSAVVLQVPDTAENGAVVPVSVQTSLPKVESISIFVQDNPTPLAASFELEPGMEADVSTRIKMAKSSTVIAVVKADGKLYTTRKDVKVTVGGCAG